jgi:hypothetical protein
MQGLRATCVRQIWGQQVSKTARYSAEVSIPKVETTCDCAYGLIEIMDKSGRSKKR